MRQSIKMIYQFKTERSNTKKINFDINLQKDKRVYCFIGENGVGKTQLLETLARSVLYSHSLLINDETYYKEFFLKVGINEKLKELNLHLPDEIKINNKTIKNKNLQPWGATQFELLPMRQRECLFKNPIVFIGAKNRGYAKNINSDSVKFLGNTIERFLSAFLKSFNSMNAQDINDTSTAQWFVSNLMINPSFVYGQKKADQEVLLLCKLLQDLEPIKLKNLVVYKQDKESFSLRIGYYEGMLFFNEIPFDKLSTGYISIIKIFQDIIDAYSSWRINDSEKIEDTEGIVFIDEVEAHLHAKWEQAILPLLKKHFPKTTFYVATHSPLVVSSTDEGEAYELVQEGEYIVAKELGNPKSWYMADIYSQAFHVKYNEDFEKEQGKIIELSANFSKTVKEFIQTKATDKKEKAEELYRDLDKVLADSDPRRLTIDNLKKLVG